MLELLELAATQRIPIVSFCAGANVTTMANSYDDESKTPLLGPNTM